MNRPISLAALAVVLLTTRVFAAGVGDKRPTGPAPRSIIVDKAEPATGQVTFVETRITMVPEQRQVVRERDGKQETVVVTVLVPVQTTVQVSISLKPGEVYSLAGEMLQEKDIWKRVMKGTTILISADGKPVDPVHLKKAGSDTVILVPAKPEPAARPRD